jgi:transposase
LQKHNIIKLLGIQGVLVKNIKESENYLEIDIETKRKVQQCPSCKYFTNKVHDYRIQRIQHISIGKRLTFLNLNKRRYCCHHCGKQFYESYSFLQKYFRKSNTVFENVCEDLKSLKNFKTIAKDNDVSIPTVVRFMHYNFYLSNKHNFNLPERIGIDEFKGNCGDEKYQFHIFDLDTRKTIDIVKSRKYDDLETYFSSFSLEQRCKVKVVSMDLYSPFKRIIKDKFYHSIIVADTFHFTKIVMQALDELRLNLWRNTQGKEKKYFKYLKLSLAKDISKVKDKEADKLLYAFELSPVLKYAYYLKQQFLDIKKLNSFDEKEKAFRTWLDDAESSTIKEFKKPVKTLRQWHEYISNSFKLNLSNGPVEGKNNLIKVLKRISFGFRNLTNFKERIILCSL